MIRVLYTWDVDLVQEAEFVDTWREATLRIRATEPGALGSTLTRDADEPEVFVAIARWRRRADVEAFWSSGHAVPMPGASLRSVAVLEEIEHLTIEPPLAVDAN